MIRGTLNVRYANTSDAKLLSELGAKTFFDTFAMDNTPEDMAEHLKRSFSPEIQLAELSAADTIFLIAESENNAIGYAQLIKGTREEVLKGSLTLEIRRIYALQDYIGQGIGKTLMQACIAEARQQGCDSIWLGVWVKNSRAVAFYKKWGFMEVGTHLFHVGNDPQTDIIMELMLM